MDRETAAALYRYFGYVPQEADGERWVVYRDEMLVVVHPQRVPRFFRKGCRGSYFEIDPTIGF